MEEGGRADELATCLESGAALAWNDTLYSFDPTHAAFTTLGIYRLGQGPLLATVADGTAPPLLAATPDHVWRLPRST